MSTLHERIARDRERSGLPFYVEDEALLDKLADLVVDTWAAMASEGRTDWSEEGTDHARPA